MSTRGTRAAAAGLDDEEVDVLIVGAGAAGLYCAETLLKREPGLRVAVLEADSRVGGRVYGCTGILERPIDLGAELVHGLRTALGKYVQRKKLRLRRQMTWAQGDGEVIPVGDLYCGYYFATNRQFMRFDQLDADIQEVNDVLFSMSEVQDDDPSVLRGKSVAEYLRSRGLSPRALRLANVGYAHTLAQNMDRLLMSEVVKVEQKWDRDGDGDFRLDEGMSKVIDLLAEGKDVRINWCVSQLEYDKNECRVVSEDGRAIKAQRVVITPSPPAIARHIMFSPALPPYKAKAINAITLRDGAKLILVLKKRLWPRNFQAIMCVDCKLPEIWFDGEYDRGGLEVVHQNGKDKILEESPEERAEIEAKNGRYTATSFLTSNFADWFATVSLEEAKTIFIDQLDDILHAHGCLPEGESVAKYVIDVKGHSWSSEPYVLGAYSSANVHEMHRAHLRSPIQKTLFWAGEATEDSYMTVGAAMRSGLRAAEEVLRSLGRRGNRSRL
eukprot:TRINITY_DN2136_c0_g1_i1.p1 TRINITY_DN2136_c0_g1~~TRINITY_DN2136_c0_g1_i1.p1  ORF type:complete len:514 (+),score=145.79 TRINITY_DN2136_c0_g1_i1:51-1544(+)